MPTNMDAVRTIGFGMHICIPYDVVLQQTHLEKDLTQIHSFQFIALLR